MLLTLDDLVKEFKLSISGILHVGAHECEELDVYKQHLKDPSKIIWIEANPELVLKMKKIHKTMDIRQAAISDTDGAPVSLMITNNGQSSSILEFGKHQESYPHIKEIKRIATKSITLNTLLKHDNLRDYNFLNIDIQGAELLALKGATVLLLYLDYLYLEVNDDEVYKKCGLVHEIDTFVATFGFVRVKTFMTEHHWGDALYIKQYKDIKHDKDIKHRDNYIRDIDMNDIKSLQFDNSNHTVNGQQYLWLNYLLPVCRVIFDVGVGLTLTFPDHARVTQHCFEPNPRFYMSLMSQQTNRIHLNLTGLGSESGAVTYFSHTESVKKRAYLKCLSTCSCKTMIYITTLDKYVKEEKIQHIDFLKIDTEGYELEVLKGGSSRALAMTDMIQFEYGGTYSDNDITLSQVFKYLQSHNFTYFYLIQPTCLYQVQHPIENMKYANYITSKVPIEVKLFPVVPFLQMTTDTNETRGINETNETRGIKETSETKETIKTKQMHSHPVPTRFPTGVVCCGMPHVRNLESMQKMCHLFDIPFHQVQNEEQTIPFTTSCDFFWFPMGIISDKHRHYFTNKSILYGPHFFVLPDENMPISALYKRNEVKDMKDVKYENDVNDMINQHRQVIYTSLSMWVDNLYKECGGLRVPTLPLPFGVDTKEWSEDSNYKNVKKNTIMIYWKDRSANDLNQIESFVKLMCKNDATMDYKIIKYNSYRLQDYKQLLQQKVKFGIWIGRHESQGFALQEALSCNIPLLVWDVKTMTDAEEPTTDSYKRLQQEKGKSLMATAIPYWEEHVCGERVYSFEQFKVKISDFVRKCDAKVFTPREFMLSHLSLDVSARRLFKAFGYTC